MTTLNNNSETNPVRANDADIPGSFVKWLDDYRERPILGDDGIWYASIPDAMAMGAQYTKSISLGVI